MLMFEELKDLGVDVDGTIKRFNGAVGIYKRFLLKFPNNEYFQKLSDELYAENINFAELERVAHSFKGNVGNIGMTKLWEYLQQIELNAKNQIFDGNIDLFTKFKPEYENIISVINKYSG